jgi:hypothetical protein
MYENYRLVLRHEERSGFARRRKNRNAALQRRVGVRRRNLTFAASIGLEVGRGRIVNERWRWLTRAESREIGEARGPEAVDASNKV